MNVVKISIRIIVVCKDWRCSIAKMDDEPSSPVRVSPRSVEKQVELDKVKKLKDVRRSGRDPNQTLLEKTDYKVMIEKILSNHPETVVLKIKHHMLADVNSAVLDGVFAALAKNTVCEVSTLNQQC